MQALLTEPLNGQSSLLTEVVALGGRAFGKTEMFCVGLVLLNRCHREFVEMCALCTSCGSHQRENRVERTPFLGQRARVAWSLTLLLLLFHPAPSFALRGRSLSLMATLKMGLEGIPHRFAQQGLLPTGADLGQEVIVWGHLGWSSLEVDLLCRLLR